jgi:hypothetical protein
MGYKVINCNPGNKEIARLNPTTPHSRHPSGGPGNYQPSQLIRKAHTISISMFNLIYWWRRGSPLR